MMGLCGVSYLSRLLLYVLDAGEIDPLGALARVAEVEFVLGQKHRIAIDIIGDPRAVGGYERIQFLVVVGRNSARQLEFRDLEFDRQRILGIEPRLEHVELQRTDHAYQGRRAITRAED